MAAEDAFEDEIQIVRRIAGVLLVDTLGRVLLQLRDDHAPTSPGMWGLPGGGVEEGETPEEGARRELLEETGLAHSGELILFWQGLRSVPDRPGALTEWHVYCARTTARQEEIVVGEGLAMVFTTPDDALTLTLAPAAQFLLSLFLDSPEYQRLMKGA